MIATTTLTAAGFTLKTGFTVIQMLYQVAGDINEWMDGHISNMKGSSNPTISRTGRVLEGAKLGFGMGYIAPVVVITLGQFLCGFTLEAGRTLLTAGTFSNPMAITCAALGAIYYGWNALTEEEKADTIERLRSDLDVGAEFIKAIANFVINKTKELLSSEQLDELKQYISEAASTFGRTLFDVTHAIKDGVVQVFQKTKEMTGSALDIVMDHTEGAILKMKTTAGDVGDSVVESGTELVDSAKLALADSLEKARDASGSAAESVIKKLRRNPPAR